MTAPNPSDGQPDDLDFQRLALSDRASSPDRRSPTWATGVGGRNLMMALGAVAYVGAIGLSVAHLFQHPPSKTYVIVPGEDWTRCVEVRATSERVARQAVLGRRAPAAAAGGCTVLPAITGMDSRLVMARGFNAMLIVSAILAALWMGFVWTRGWREDTPAPA